MDVAELSMMLETLQGRSVSEEEFAEAMQQAKELKNLESDQQLILYALYKQKSVGDATRDSKPPQSDVIASAKWNTWNQFRGFPKDSAALAYVYLVSTMVEAESADDGTRSGQAGNSFESMEVISTLHEAGLLEASKMGEWTEEQSLFKAVVDHDLDALQKCISKGCSVNSVSEEGMTPLHYAADRGFRDILEMLVENGAELNKLDSGGDTPIMYALACDNLDIVEALLAHKAAIALEPNDEGLPVIDLEDLSSEARALITLKS